MRHFTATEAQRDFDLVAFSKETFDRAHLHIVIVIINARAHLDLFDFDDLLMFARFGGLLLLLVFKFTIIKNFAHRRRGVWRDLDEIHTDTYGALKRCRDERHTNIGAGFINQSTFFGPDHIVEPGAFWLALLRVSRHWTTDVRSP